MGIFKLNGIDYMGGGGGGNTNYEELTQAEYDALTPAQRNNGTVYYITDANSNNGTKFQPIIYSEAERVVGCWIDGRPLYQKTISMGTLTQDTSWHSIAHNISNIDKIISCKGIVINESDQTYYPFPNYRPTVTQGIVFGASATDIKYIQNWLEGTNIGYATIQYTKTTDAPGSGYWTPQGVPAQHYSTEEQIVGTWIDGSTVYKKVFTNLSVATNGISWVHISSIDTTTWGEVLDCKIYRKMNNKYTAIPIAEYSGYANQINDLAVSIVSSPFDTTINMAIVQYTKS